MTKQKEGVTVSTEAEPIPQTAPVAVPTDPKVKELLEKITTRMDTLETGLFEGRKMVEDQKIDLKKMADFITENHTLTFADLLGKAQGSPTVKEASPRTLQTVLGWLIPDLSKPMFDIGGSSAQKAD